jgi:hypothetical protein
VAWSIISDESGASVSGIAAGGGTEEIERAGSGVEGAMVASGETAGGALTAGPVEAATGGVSTGGVIAAGRGGGGAGIVAGMAAATGVGVGVGRVLGVRKLSARSAAPSI